MSDRFDSVPVSSDRPYLGVMLMLGFCLLVPMADAIAKVLGSTVSLWLLLVVRFVSQAVLLMPLVWFSSRTFRIPRRLFGLVVARSILHILGIGGMFLSLRYLPLADAVAIAFVMPFILLLLGRYVLGEAVGPARMIACTIGFGGTLLVVQPSFAQVGAFALLPLFVAVVFALFMLVTRPSARVVDPISLQVVGGWIGVVILAVVFILLQLAGYDSALSGVALRMPDQRDAWLLLTTGVLGTVAHLMMTWSLRYAPSATLAPMQYLEIPAATVYGWLIFNDIPNGLAAVGILITIAAGLAIVISERATSRRSVA